MNATGLRTLHEDRRGAVMLMGLCMSCLLIGALWFVIGIGDAIVFRDGMQEAADHAAFTSAALHAKGMNFISACNLILLALISIHILLGMLHDIALAVCILFAIPTLGASCEPYPGVRRVYVGYAKIFKPAATVIHYAEIAAAYGYPYIGFIKGYTLGNDYSGELPKDPNLNVLALSPSMVPGGALDGVLNKAFGKVSGGLTTLDEKGKNEGKKKALPVEGKKFNSVCEKIGKMGIDALLGMTGSSKLGKSGVVGFVKGLIGGVIKFRYCNDMGTSLTPDIMGSIDQANGKIDEANTKITENNNKLPADATPKELASKIDIGGGLDPGLDSWWGKEGPLVPWGGTMNGSPWNQVWAVNLSPDYTDDQEHAVSIAQREYGKTSTAKPSFAYVAEAEFYFDCTGEWGDAECNKDDNAGYSVQWRARLKRLQAPEVGSLLTSFGANFLTRLKGYKDFQKWVTGKFKGLEKYAGALGMSTLEGAIEQTFKTFIDDPLQEAGNAAGGGLNPSINGNYH